jgi:hypothetical protein
MQLAARFRSEDVKWCPAGKSPQLVRDPLAWRQPYDFYKTLSDLARGLRALGPRSRCHVVTRRMLRRRAAAMARTYPTTTKRAVTEARDGQSYRHGPRAKNKPASDRCRSTTSKLAGVVSPRYGCGQSRRLCDKRSSARYVQGRDSSDTLPASEAHDTAHSRAGRHF